MIDEARRAIEREARLGIDRVIDQALSWRLIRATYLLIYGISGFAAFCILLITQVAESLYPAYSYAIDACGLAFAINVLLACQLVRFSADRTSRVAGRVSRFINSARQRFRQDFLALHFFAALLFLWLPFALTFLLNASSMHGWVLPGSPAFKSTDSLRALTMTFAGALLGAQLTLFTFLLSDLLGRFSGDLGETLLWHRAVLSVVLFPLVALALLGSATVFGYPVGVARWPDTLLLLLFLCLVFSVLVTARAIATERAVRYVGVHFAKRVRRFIKPPVAKLGQAPGPIWKAIAFAGLDFRDPARADLSGPPRRAVGANRLLRPLFNVLNQALRDGQHEVFDAGLEAVYTVVRAYTDQRQLYFGSQDPVFAFLNDQFAGVLGATARDSDQYLITDATKYITAIGALTLQIAPHPNDPTERVSGVYRPNDLAVAWFRLLQESFELSHVLMRSTAASSALGGLDTLAIAALQAGYCDLINYTYLPIIERLQQLCCQNADAYHSYLAEECIHGMLRVWALSFSMDRKDLSIQQQMLSTLKSIVEAQMSRRSVLLDPNSVVGMLTAKTSEQIIILQDIWFLALDMPGDADTKRIRLSRAMDLLELLPIWVRRAIETRQILTQYLIQAFYEMTYGAIRGFSSQTERDRREITRKIFKCWSRLLELLMTFGQDVPEWEYYLFSVIGYAAARCEGDAESVLREYLRQAVAKFVTLLLQRKKEKDAQLSTDLWDYLQLVGAWTASLLSDESLAQQIVNILAEAYPRRDLLWEAGSPDEPFGTLGYPTRYHSDFFLPNLMNIRIHVNKEQWIEFQISQARVVAPEVLIPYAQSIKRVAEEREKEKEEL